MSTVKRDWLLAIAVGLVLALLSLPITLTTDAEVWLSLALGAVSFLSIAVVQHQYRDRSED